MESYLIHISTSYCYSQHPCIHPIKEVYYSAAYEKLIMVQPFRTNGSLKDVIYKVSVVLEGCTEMNSCSHVVMVQLHYSMGLYSPSLLSLSSLSLSLSLSLPPPSLSLFLSPSLSPSHTHTG